MEDGRQNKHLTFNFGDCCVESVESLESQRIKSSVRFAQLEALSFEAGSSLVREIRSCKR